jgi:hypothetical protein
MIRCSHHIVCCVLMSASFAPAQQASYTTYGPACGGTHGDPPTMPVLWATGLPRLGSSFTVHYQSPRIACGRNYISPFLVTGKSAVAWRITDLGPVILGGPNCYVLSSAEVLQIDPWGGATGQLTFVVPNDNALLGLRLYQQWWLLYMVACPQGVIHYAFLTNGGAMGIGI